ncbi:DUF5949 family protein [Streptomyces boncukensis]|uniref:Uncharacterized protein n=1 Tax=Streptomyces boncukensis TaxID=2711219 RepID=A0A6G4WX05_9ACTN|nr:DUF5949 family protein [Streptomyces boncukensis]NGO69819.1 hypothetical protein [Streptomyces boncukensis]
MTSQTSQTSQSAQNGFSQRRFGTLTVLGWTGEHPEEERDMPFLLVYSLGDGADGPEAGELALREMLENIGLSVGEEVLDGTAGDKLPVSLLVQSGRAVVTLPNFSVQYPATPEWLRAAEARGHSYFMFATRPWPEGVPGEPVAEETLRDFVSEEMMASAAHCVLPVRTLRP